MRIIRESKLLPNLPPFVFFQTHATNQRPKWQIQSTSPLLRKVMLSKGVVFMLSRTCRCRCYSVHTNSRWGKSVCELNLIGTVWLNTSNFILKTSCIRNAMLRRRVLLSPAPRLSLKYWLYILGSLFPKREAFSYAVSHLKWYNPGTVLCSSAACVWVQWLEIKVLIFCFLYFQSRSAHKLVAIKPYWITAVI